jgi:hypothetical protein
VLVAFIEVSGAPVELMQIDHEARPDLTRKLGSGGRAAANLDLEGGKVRRWRRLSGGRAGVPG